jgi:N-acyl-L-homoserine lactone synthetase
MYIREINVTESLQTIRSNNVELRSDRFVARNLDFNNKFDMDNAYSFRYRVFHKELGWESRQAKEYDEYDSTSAHFGVFSESDELVGYSRLHLPEGRFMIEYEFADLVEPGSCIRKKEDTVEASRFAISMELRQTKEGFIATELLCKTMCQWAKKNGIRYWYMVLDKSYLDFLLCFFDIETIGVPVEYTPGSASVAGIVNISKLGIEEANAFWNTLGCEPKPE